MKNLDSVLDSYLGIPDLDFEIGARGYAAGTGIGAVFAGPTAPVGALIGFGVTGLVDIVQIDKLAEITTEKIRESLTETSDRLTFKNSPYNLRGGVKDGTLAQSEIDYIFKDGAIRMTPIARYVKPNDTVPEKLKQRYFVSWGWFEDVVLSTFFELNTKENSDKPTELIQEIYSATKEDNVDSLNLCQSHEYLYSMGLDYTILPGKHHPIMKKGFSDLSLSEKRKAKRFYTKEQRNNLARVYHFYKIIDENFKPFVNIKTRPDSGPNGEEILKNSKGKYYYVPKDDPNSAVIVQNNPNQSGVIRNMVFPIELLQKHFGGMSSLKSAMTNFWADVNNQYGGYWDFKIGQDADKKNVIGVSDLNLSEPKQPARFENLSGKEDYYDFINTKPDPEKTFVFSVFSKDSIVTSFDVNLDLSAEAATIARYGSNTSQAKLNGVDVLAIKAWNLINNSELAEDVKDQQEQKRIEKFKNLEVYKDLKYPTDDGIGQGYITDNYDSNSSSFASRPLADNKGLRFGNIKTIKEDDAKQAERIENQRIQFIKGVGIYDKFGNFSQYFKGTMNYIINSSLEDGSESLIQTSEPLLPVTLSMELDGIGGLRVGDLFKVDYLPVKYRDFCYFIITKIDHNIANTGWSTSIEAAMVADLPLFWTGKKNALNRPVNFMEWFKSTTFDLETLITDSDSPLLTNVDEKIAPFQKQIADINLLAFTEGKGYKKIISETEEQKSGIFGGFVKEKIQSANRAARIAALKTRIAFNIRQMNNTFDRLEQKLSVLGDIKLTYTDFLGAQKTTTANELIALCQQQKADVVKELIKIDLYNEPTDNYDSVATAQDIPQAGSNPYVQNPEVGGDPLA